jgi:NAD(P)-dependent dehydrogenase (short-subunit alcohol dehydrogenase family)
MFWLYAEVKVRHIMFMEQIYRLISLYKALVGTIEELSQTARARSLVRDQFETNLFAPVNVIKAVLPVMREKKSGHIIVITGISENINV